MNAASHFVIVGGGLAAAKAIETLRGEGFEGDLCLISEENRLPYERPALSKEYLQGKSSAKELEVQDADWYADNNITLRLGSRVDAIDAGSQKVRLGSGEEISYDKLLLATGARPRKLPIPGSDYARTLRSIEDSDKLRDAFGDVSDVVIIGAGWIGLEVAAAARAVDLNVTVVEYGNWPLQRVMGDELGEYFAHLHRSNEVNLRVLSEADEIEGHNNQVDGVKVGDELIPADLVLMGVGAVPNTELAKAAGLDVDNGIIVDEHLRSSDDNIYAAGDNANAYNTTMGRSLRVEHWDNAIRQGELAGKAMLDEDAVYDWQPYFFTDQYDLGMEYVGNAATFDKVVIRGDKSSGEFIAFWLSDGEVLAAMNVNIWDVNDDLRALLGKKIDVEKLANSEIALTDLA